MQTSFTQMQPRYTTASEVHTQRVTIRPPFSKTYTKAVFGCDDNNNTNTPNTDTPAIEPKKTYSYGTKLKSHFKLKKLSLNPFAFRLESNLLWSVGIGISAGLFTGVGFALTPGIFVAMTIGSFIAAAVRDKPLDLIESKNTLSKEQQAYKDTYTPTIKAIGEFYKTIGTITSEYQHHDSKFHVKHTGEKIKSLNLGINPESFKHAFEMLINLYDDCERANRKTELPHRQPKDETRLSNLNEALMLSQQILKGITNPNLNQNGQNPSPIFVKDISPLKKSADPTSRHNTYTTLKKHRESLIHLLQLGIDICSLKEEAQPITLDKAINQDKLTELLQSIPRLTEEDVITPEQLNTFLQSYQNILVNKNNAKLLNENRKIMSTFLDQSKSHLSTEFKKLGYTFKKHTRPTIYSVHAEKK